MEMEVKRVDKRQKDTIRKKLDSGEFKIVPVSKGEGAQNVNVDKEDIVQKEGVFDIGTAIPSLFTFDEDRRYTKEDLSYNFLALKWASRLKMSPFGFGEDGNSRNFPRFTTSHKKWWENGVSFVWFFLASIRLLVAILSAAHFVMTQNTKEKLHHLTVMIVGTVGYSLMIYILYCYKSNVQNMAPFLFSIFKHLDADADADSKSELEKKKKSQAQKFRVGFGFGFGKRRHTFKELSIIHLPFFVYSMAVNIPLLSATDPSFPFLLVSLIKPEMSFSFLFLATFDSLVAVYYLSLIHMDFYIFIGMHRILEEAKLTIKNLKTKNENENENEKSNKIKVQKALKNISLLHIWTHFFNTSFSNVIYAAKLGCLTASISGGFGFIKMMEVENWPYAGVLGLFFLDSSIIYNIVFGRAFEITERIDELKREIQKQSFKTYKNHPFERKCVEKYLRSIPWLGVKDGVYKMERMTCVNFLDFVLQQIIDLVLAY